QGRGRNRVPSLDGKVLRALQEWTADPRAADSLQLIQDYRQAASLLVRLRAVTRHVDARSGRIHSTFDDRQASGRSSSTYPNLQQLAKAREVAGVEVRSRNALRASDGFELAVFDIAQADIRVLAHAVESFPRTAREHDRELASRRR